MVKIEPLVRKAKLEFHGKCFQKYYSKFRINYYYYSKLESIINELVRRSQNM